MSKRSERVVFLTSVLQHVKDALNLLDSRANGDGIEDNILRWKCPGDVWFSLGKVEKQLQLRIDVHTRPEVALVSGKTPKRPEKGYGYQSQVIPVLENQEAKIIRHPPAERIVGRKVIGWSSCCGTYGMGGPGFFGLRLEATGLYQEEWLILTLWGADNWIEVDGRWLSSTRHKPISQSSEILMGIEAFYPTQIPLTDSATGNGTHGWDEFTPLVVGEQIAKFRPCKRKAEVTIGETKLLIHEDPRRRPLTGG